MYNCDIIRIDPGKRQFFYCRYIVSGVHVKWAAMYDLFGDKFDLNHDGRLSAAEHMMDFSVFNYWATDDDDDDGDGADRDRSSESYFDDDNDFDNCDSDDCDDDIGDDFEDDDEENDLW